MVRTLGGDMQVGDLFRFVDTYDIHNIGVGSIGIILREGKNNKTGFYYVLINGGHYFLPFHHVEEIKCK